MDHKQLGLVLLVVSSALILSAVVVLADTMVGANQLGGYVEAVNLFGIKCAEVDGTWTFWYDTTTAQFVTTQPYAPIWHTIANSYCFGYSSSITYDASSSSTTKLHGLYEFKISTPIETQTGTVEIYIVPWGSQQVQLLTYFGQQITNNNVYTVPVDIEVNAY